MKRLNIFLIFSFILAVFTGCVKDEAISDEVQYELTVKMEMDAPTRTSLSGLQGDMYYPLWSAGDELAVFVDGDASPSKFTLKSGEGATKATFAGTREGSYYYALYPFSDTTRMENGAILFTLPSVQEYMSGSFGIGSYPMVAYGASETLNFKNLCAVMKISITGDAAVRSITLQSKDEEAYLSGKVKVNFGDDSSLQMQILEGGSNSVTLDCKGTELAKDSVTDFHFVIPAQSYKGGFDVIIDVYTDTIEKSVASDLEFKRSQIRHLKGMVLDLEMDEHQRRLIKEKAALIEFYEALNGENWINNENWCSDRPVGEWYGIYTNQNGYVSVISFQSPNNIKGAIPESIAVLSDISVFRILQGKLEGDVLSTLSGLKELLSIELRRCDISGVIPDKLCALEKLQYLDLSDNKLTGKIPTGIGNLINLSELNLRYNSLTGQLPVAIGKLKNLTRLRLEQNKISGTIPVEFSSLENLCELELSWNNLSGNIPEFIADFSNLDYLYLYNNSFTGILPKKFQYMPLWPEQWGMIVFMNSLNLSEVVIPALDFNVIDINGNQLSSADVYTKNKCVIFIDWDPDTVRYEESLSSDGKDKFLVELNRLYNIYSDKGLEIIGYCYEYAKVDDIKNIIAEYEIKWPIFQATRENFFTNNGKQLKDLNYPLMASPAVFAVNTTDKEIGFFHSDYTYNAKLRVEDYVMAQLGIEPDHYVSTDYTQDGTTVQLQKATEGNGINVVLMGDGYSDRQIADGSYKADMEYVYSKLFTKEPYQSYKHLFNVSYVNAVSATEGFEYGNTALSCGFGDGTYVYGNDNAVFQYAQKVVESSKIDETLVIVVLNSNNYAGTCFMYYPNSSGTDHGKGAAVAYFPKGESSETFAQLLHHEANGHGFAKLADEYAYEEYGAVPAEEVENTKNQQSLYGWWKNVDFTNDPAQVRWKKFLEDTRYAKEGLGVFEGGLTYWSGVWRPTENSIMRYNQGEFNAPSREAIYYRMHKLAYGADWKYDYEKFVEYDAVNRKSAATRSYVLPLRPQERLHPPVVVARRWNEM